MIHITRIYLATRQKIGKIQRPTLQSYRIQNQMCLYMWPSWSYFAHCGHGNNCICYAAPSLKQSKIVIVNFLSIQQQCCLITEIYTINLFINKKCEKQLKSANHSYSPYFILFSCLFFAYRWEIFSF